MLLTTTAFAEVNQDPAPSVENTSYQGLESFIEEQNKAAAEVEDKLGYKNMKENALKAYAPNEKVRVIVEVEEPSEQTESLQTKSVPTKKDQFKQKQDQVISQLSKKKSVTKVKHRFYKGFNGFSMDTEFKNIKAIQSTPGVKNVHIAKVFQPSMGASKELVQAQKVWEQYGYEGEGLLVAIVDSGIDHTHQDMTLTEKGKEKEKWTESSIQENLSETAVNDVWYSEKVPTGYDWADNDEDVIPRGKNGSPHGMHVAGTVGANGDEENDGVKGIAPGVQLLAEKVFSDNGGGAYEDDIIAGIEHAVTMGADVINMSLGSDSGFVGEENDPIQKAIREATEQGTLVVTAGGNTAYSTKNNIIPSSTQPYAENPDIGTVGEPGVSPYALSVASYENTKIHMNTLTEKNGLQLPYQDQTQYNFTLSKTLSPGESYEMVYVGEGFKAEHYEGKDVTGKIAVIKPNKSYYEYGSMQREAQKRGAKALLIVPADTMADYPFIKISPVFIPGVTTSKEAGDSLISKLTSGHTVKMEMTKGTWVENATKNTMSNFSSMGAPHTLDFKPEISAPGGKIYSTVPGNGYETMSGTSMASPHVAGGAALLLQSLYDKGLTQSKDTALKAKIALMNTSKAVMDPRLKNALPYSPRVQGAGLMQIQHAIDTPAIVTNHDAPLEQAGAVALKEIKGRTVTFKLDLEAFKGIDAKKLEYDIFVDVMQDETETKEFDLDSDGQTEKKDYLTLTSKRPENVFTLINGKEVTDKQGTKIKINPGQKKTIHVTMLLPKNLKENTFLEGFVRLVPSGENKETAVPLTVPYMGFHGEWDSLQNLDPAAWDKDAFLGYTALWDDEGDQFPMGYDPATDTFNLDRIAISPNSILNGVFPTFTALRNLAKTEMYVEDSKGKVVQYLGDFSEFTGKPWKYRKNIMSYMDLFYNGYLWDVKDQNGQAVKDGTYNFVIKTTLDYKNAKDQEVKLPLKVDSVSPVVSDIQVQPKDGQYEISFKGADDENGAGFNGAIIWYNGKYKSLPSGQTSLLIKDEPKSIVVMGIDYAMNISYTVWGDPSYIKAEMLVPVFLVSPSTNVNANRPASINGFANTRVNWTINVKDEQGKVVDSIIIENEHEIHEKWTPKKDLPNGTYTVTAEAIDKQGFKVTTSPKTITVQQQ
ncbi:hypothetical protein AF332_26185 [Sporosarcina globispora]|uniref:Peptidase S8 n=2 Tax=Sporosarcina globispora TaxID=1459 RepID=A0A0M0GLY6_SPOGL|nr:hypothetical protein AF332_26185 [Sporosarcina globispora]